MRPGVDIALERIADDLLALAVAIMEDDSISNNLKVNKNTLRDSALKNDLYVTIAQSNADDPVISAFFNHYVIYLEWDRPPEYGKQPPISALRDWATKNGIPTDTQTLYAISYAIWRDGHAGRPIFATMDRETDKLFLDDWAPLLRDAFFEELNKFFN